MPDLSAICDLCHQVGVDQDSFIIYTLSLQDNPQHFCHWFEDEDKNKYARLSEGLTVQFFTTGVQQLHVNGVASDEASPLVHWELLPLDLDTPSLVEQHRQTWARRWF